MGMECRNNNLNNSFTGTSLNSSTYNQDERWSTLTSVASGGVNAFTNAFNGDRANKLQTGGNAVLVTVDLSSYPITVTDYIEIHGEDYGSADFRYTVTINGMTHTKDVDSVVEFADSIWVEL